MLQYILSAEQFSLCVTVVITGFALGHVCLFMLRFFILSLGLELTRCPIVLSHVWPLELCGFRIDFHYCYHFARHSPNNRAIIGHHKCLFELWVCFTQVRRVLSSSATTSSASGQTSSQGFEILSRWTAFADPAPFRSIELFRLGRWALCHTAESFKRPTCRDNI